MENIQDILCFTPLAMLALLLGMRVDNIKAGRGRNAQIQQLVCRYVKQKWEKQVSLHFLCLDVYSLLEGKFFAGSEVLTFHNQYKEELVINYIENHVITNFCSRNFYSNVCIYCYRKSGKTSGFVNVCVAFNRTGFRCGDA